MQIEEKPPFDTPFEWIGGEARVSQALGFCLGCNFRRSSFAVLIRGCLPLRDFSCRRLPLTPPFHGLLQMRLRLSGPARLRQAC